MTKNEAAVIEAARKWREKRLTMNVGDIDRDFILIEVDLQNAVEALDDAPPAKSISGIATTIGENTFTICCDHDIRSEITDRVSLRIEVIDD